MTARPLITNTQRLIILGVTLLLAGLGIWFFSNIIVFILVSFVISMIGEPIVSLMQKIRIRKWHVPRAIGSFIVVILFWAFVFAFFYTFIPLLAKELKYFSNIDLKSLLTGLEEPFGKVQKFLQDFKLIEDNFSLQAWASESVKSLFGVNRFSSVLTDFAGFIGNTFIAVLSISFISFYFMKETQLFEDGVVLIFPEEKEQNVRHAIHSISGLLKRYFIGVMLQSTGVITLNTLGLTLVGFKFEHAAIIALFSGILNVIPYVGPFIGSLIGLAIGTAVSLPMDFQTGLLTRWILILAVMESTKVVDNLVFQPQIFSRSVKAHPLEIFIIILMAATIGGVIGMLIAIPSYTVIRVVAKEFFSQSKLVRKITEKL